MSETHPRRSRANRKYRVSVGPSGRLGACLLVAPDENESDVAVVEHSLAPGLLGSPLHRHTREDAVCIVYAGQMTFLEDGETRTAAAGDVVLKPRGRWHAFWNDGDDTLRFYQVIAPGAFAWYYADVAPYLGDSEFPWNEARAAIEEFDAAYGLAVDDESVPALVDEYDLRM